MPVIKLRRIIDYTPKTASFPGGTQFFQGPYGTGPGHQGVRFIHSISTRKQLKAAQLAAEGHRSSSPPPTLLAALADAGNDDELPLISWEDIMAHDSRCSMSRVWCRGRGRSSGRCASAAACPIARLGFGRIVASEIDAPNLGGPRVESLVPRTTRSARRAAARSLV